MFTICIKITHRHNRNINFDITTKIKHQSIILMTFTHIKKHDFKTATWSGGTTTQLFIYPESGNYKTQNFDFRLSTATVEIPQSDFTPLPNFLRKLMILNGTLRIEHKGHYKKTLNPFESDAFSGNWKTKGFGQCIDFNLMTRTPYSGNLKHLNIDEKQCITINSGFCFFALYWVNGASDVYIDHQQIAINQGDMLIINTDSQPITATIETHCAIDLVKIEVLKS